MSKRKPTEPSRRGSDAQAEAQAHGERSSIRRGLGRGRAKEYKRLYREEFVAAHGGGATGRAALREARRLEQRVTRRVRYFPLLFQTDDGRYRLWTWQGPSKLFLRSVEEAERTLFFPTIAPVVVPYDDQLDRHLHSALRAAAKAIPFQALAHREQVAYAFLLWNEVRRYHYASDLLMGQDPTSADSCFRLASYLLVEVMTRPLDYLRFLVLRERPNLEDFIGEVGTSEFDPSDPADEVVLRYRDALTAAHGWFAASGLVDDGASRARQHHPWFRAQGRKLARRKPDASNPNDEAFLTLSASDLPLPLPLSLAGQRRTVRRKSSQPTATTPSKLTRPTKRRNGRTKRQRATITKRGATASTMTRSRSSAAKRDPGSSISMIGVISRCQTSTCQWSTRAWRSSQFEVGPSYHPLDMAGRFRTPILVHLSKVQGLRYLGRQPHNGHRASWSRSNRSGRAMRHGTRRPPTRTSEARAHRQRKRPIPRQGSLEVDRIVSCVRRRKRRTLFILDFEEGN